jgi:hypothetical protein
MSDDKLDTPEEEYEEVYEDEDEEYEEVYEDEKGWDLPKDAPVGLNDFDFVEAYDDEPADDDRMLEDNTAQSAINCAFLGSRIQQNTLD